MLMLKRLKKLFTIRFVLTIMLIISCAFAGYRIYYKVKYWGFSFAPHEKTNIWTVEANVSFVANGEPINISLAKPKSSDEYKILDEDVVAPGYKTKISQDRISLTSDGRDGQQNVYYRILLFDNTNGKGKIAAPAPKAPEKPIFTKHQEQTTKELISLASKQTGDAVQQLIRLFNQTPPEPTVVAFLPANKTPKDLAQIISNLLAYQGISSRLARGIKLQEDKTSMEPDLMLEAYMDGRWKLYDLTTGQIGLPKDFIIIQRGGKSLLDIAGGYESNVKFSVLKSVTTSFNLAGKRAKLSNEQKAFDSSIYNLPVAQQNTIKWLMIFPLAILVIAVVRNVIGLSTMGTFTPMLIAMALVKTGLVPGLICFVIIMTLGLLIRALFSKLNLLLVPRISAVVVCVILIIQYMCVFSYQLGSDIGSSAMFFPIIIMAWIIERASITWEEDGPFNSCREIVFSLVAALATYVIICNSTIRYIMFAFNELNLVLLFVIMLLGTYTGYRLTELKRFRPLVK